MKFSIFNSQFSIRTEKEVRDYGFTLVELLLVIAMLGLLATFVIFSLQGQTAKARDSSRRLDIKQYQTAIEAYANTNSTYPIHTSKVVATSLCSTELRITGTCTDDPQGVNHYYYISDASGTSFVLWATLEYPKSPITYWVVCSNGKSDTWESLPGSSTCPLP
jgi:prepilin-type N-terminal cleavage/methylation domain-containing protein